jgi:linoleoyl-CoA desaturase
VSSSAVLGARTSAALSLIAEAMRPSARELVAARRRLHRKAIVVIAVALAAYWTLVLHPASPVVKVLAAGALTVAAVALATGVFHDGAHGSFSRSSRLNRMAAWTGDVLGASSWIWRFKHNNLHHGNTNVDGVDADIAQDPFARLSPTQPWHWWHAGQHVYMWPLYGFLPLQWLLRSDVADLRRGGIDAHAFPRPPRRRDVVVIGLGKAIHLTWALAIPMLFHAWWVVLVVYVAMSWTFGLALSTMFQLAHCTELAEFPSPDEPRRGEHFVEHQLRTTADVHCRTPLGATVLGWLMGGLDHQVEHHLAPKLPHTAYPVVAPRLELACLAGGLRVASHCSPWAAIRSHGRWLRLMGRRP